MIESIQESISSWIDFHQILLVSKDIIEAGANPLLYHQLGSLIHAIQLKQNTVYYLLK